jgi:hypothetical protein
MCAAIIAKALEGVKLTGVGCIGMILHRIGPSSHPRLPHQGPRRQVKRPSRHGRNLSVPSPSGRGLGSWGKDRGTEGEGET